VLHRRVAEQEPREPLEPLAPAGGVLEDGVAAGDLLAQLARDLEVVRRLAPGAADLVGVGPGSLLDDERVGREQLEQRAALSG
jgi:hypothetical protein